ncbi:MAG: antitoxin [Gammaproteobacteria bacterium]|nr:antitoxin [Gammaproteobacteria bacterium]MCW8841667.1 antitoxin [Gammaproteobacteria bacterium]MCW8958115.1 antitoxin [Gammaproteobacteria bacterium]MCW8973704.1 antitoxin [Gammaproteobacteria bacterium]MCW8993568.1 antitoxin [Gammaproteobacteria bacterium]
MHTELSPIVSEFDTAEQESRYLLWLRGKVESSLADPSPCRTHDEVMAEAAAVIVEIVNVVHARREFP